MIAFFLLVKEALRGEPFRHRRDTKLLQHA
jgi:hypothetical protein